MGLSAEMDSVSESIVYLVSFNTVVVKPIQEARSKFSPKKESNQKVCQNIPISWKQKNSKKRIKPDDDRLGMLKMEIWRVIHEDLPKYKYEKITKPIKENKV